MTGHTLILLRHGKSDWSGQHSDLDRPLAVRGRRQAPETGRWLAGHAEPIELAVTSPARRARSTWKLVSAELSRPPEVRVDERVYSWHVADLVEVVHGLPAQVHRAALVGHNPGLEELVLALTGQDVRMPTSAVAVVQLPGPWDGAGAGTGSLVAAGRPPAEETGGRPS